MAKEEQEEFEDEDEDDDNEDIDEDLEDEEQEVEVKKPVKTEKKLKREAEKVEINKESVDNLDNQLNQILSNHEQRLQSIEAALFRLRGSI